MAIEIIEEQIESCYQVKSKWLFFKHEETESNVINRKSIRVDHPHELEQYQNLRLQGIEACHSARQIIEKEDGNRYVIENGRVVRIDIPCKKPFLAKVIEGLDL